MTRYAKAIAILGLVLTFALIEPPSASATKRLAFVVGINLYDNLVGDQQLKRAVADAQALSRTFKELQFEVVDGENLGREGFLVAWQSFLGLISPGDTVAVFFAGHGIEIRGANFLMPRDVPSAAKGELVLRGAGIPLADVLDQLTERSPSTALVILDACRNNPFSVSGRSIGGARGLARIDDRPGTLILYSAGIGQVALDHVPGEPQAANSVFTHTLVPLLKTPGLDLLDVAKQTQRRVDALARRESHTQTPAFYSQLLQDVHLAGKPATVPLPSAIEPETVRKASAAEKAKGEAELAERVAEVTRMFHEDLRRSEEDRKRKSSAVPPPVIDPASLVTPGSGRGFRDRLADGRECSHCPEMVVVPAGSFMMGTSKAEVASPAHVVRIGKSFAVAKYEVTFDEWEGCVRQGACYTYKGHDAGWGRGRMPVIRITWDAAKAYVSWLSMTTGKPYRMLSEAEWEYTARAGTRTDYYWGDIVGDSLAHCSGCSSRPSRKQPLTVGSFKPNAFGLHDMLGNVYEWVEDCHHANYTSAPANGTAWTSGDCASRVHRGGAWSTPPDALRVWDRSWNSPTTIGRDLGFRVARSL